MNRQYRLAQIQLSLAIDADERRHTSRAIDCYAKSCAYLLSGIRIDQDSRSRVKAIKALKNYLSRAEYLKQSLKSKNCSYRLESAITFDDLNDILPNVNKYSNNKLHVTNNSEDVKDGFASVAGLAGVKQALNEAVILPITHPNFFSGHRKPWRGILLFGPPGTGKSYIAAALAKEAKCAFFSLTSSDIVSKYPGESERAIRKVFEHAREIGRCVIFIDEIDSIGRSRNGNGGYAHTESSRRILAELLRQIDGFEVHPNNPTFLAATNNPFDLDSALRRRFQKRIYVPMPGPKARTQILQQALGSDPFLVSLSQADCERVANKAKGFSGSDLTIVANEALMIPIRKCLTATHFKYIAKRNDGHNSTPYSYGGKLLMMFGLWKEDNVIVPCTSRDMWGQKMNIWDPHFPAEKLQVPTVTVDDLQNAFTRVKPSTDISHLEKYSDFSKKFGDKNALQDYEDDEHDEY